MFLKDSKQRTLKLNGYVGFDLIAEQYVSKQIRDGFSFNIICVGETGIGLVGARGFYSSFRIESFKNFKAKRR
jgi:hypothetical protein